MHAVFGTVKVGGKGQGGITVTLSGRHSAVTVTNNVGYYNFPQLPAGGNYIITPSGGGYTFAPASETVSNLDRTREVNFSTGTNIALGKSAAQSTTAWQTSVAAAAVDGNTDGNFAHGSVTHTGEDNEPWWQVDLGGMGSIESVNIWNRTDCCGERLSDYWLFVSEAPFGGKDTIATLQSKPGVWSSHQTTPPNPAASIRVNTKGQYVRVQVTGRLMMSLAEVQVVGALRLANLASGKAAAQSSTQAGLNLAAAENATDGNSDGNFAAGSVTHTNGQPHAWWQVDLGGTAAIQSITVWNRTDCCQDRLSDYWVFVSDQPFAATDTPAALEKRPGTWNSHQTKYPSPFTRIAVNGSGRYVRVQLAGTNYLSLAEVQITGTMRKSLATGKPATQSSTLAPGNDVATRAVDGNTDGKLAAGSVSHTYGQPNAWWQVDLESSAAIGSIRIWNRTDCCADRLSDYWVFVSDTPFEAKDTPAVLEKRPGTWSNHQTSYPNPATTIPVNASGRYVRVQLDGTNYLSLAEVEVFDTSDPLP